MKQHWHVYILRCNDNTLYTGITTDLQRRLAEHNNAGKKAARYTRARKPVTLVYQERVASRSVAATRESAIRKLSRAEKQKLIKKHL